MITFILHFNKAIMMVGILLAAGFSRRFGPVDKLLQPLPDGRPIALAAAESLVKALPISIAVLRPENKSLEKLLLNAGLKVVFCSEDKQQMADSLSTAIRFSARVEGAEDGFVIALADMPDIKPDTISKVARKLGSGASIVIPTFEGQRGHPVGFSAKFRQALEHLQGDEGARAIIKRCSSEVELIATDDAGILADIDTLADLTARL